MSDAAVSLLGRPLESVFDSFASVGFGQRTTLEFVLDHVCLKAPDFGIALIGSLAGRVESIVLYAVAADGYRPLFGDLPEGLRAGDSQAAVRERLSTPDDFGGGIVPGVRHEVPLWDRWARGSYWLRVSYDEQGVATVMAMTPETASSASTHAR